MTFIETSAKNDEKVSKAFEILVDDIISIEKTLNKSNEDNNDNKE